MKIFRPLLVIALLASAPSAFAIPLQIDISSSPAAVGAGSWNLSGPTSAGGFFAVGLGSSYSALEDLVAGDYLWSISGVGSGIGTISWNLSLGGQSIYSGSDSGILLFKISDKVSVPEPGTWSLMGAGLLALLLSTRRRLVTRSREPNPAAV